VLAHLLHWQRDSPNWLLDPPLVAIALAALLYARGLNRRAGRRRRVGAEAWLFAAGLGALLVALSPPLASLDDELFWAHMSQHVLILAVAPPLILLGRPASTTWRALPLKARRTALQALVRSSWAAPLRVAARRLATPPAALVLFCGVLIVWHIPALYDATLRSAAVHYLEHALFLATGFVFWSQLIDSPPFRSSLDARKRALYAAVAMVAGSAIGLVLALASAPLYAGYAQLPSRPGGISALADQHLAAGIMWVPGSVPFAAAFIVFVYRWLGETARDGRSASPLAEGS
jgi:putative membrane protein